MVDAIDFGGAPGEVSLLFPEKVAYSGVHNQAGSLRMLAEYIEAMTHARVALLAIQPADISEGDSMTPVVSETPDDLAKTLPDICGHHLH